VTIATPAQQGIWFTERAGIAGTAYHMAVVVKLDGPLDADAFAAACDTVVDRHPSLRTAFSDVDGVPRPVPGAPVRLARVPYTDELLAAEQARPFDLRHGPLIRFTLARAGHERHVLLVVAHHLVFDGISKDILLRDLAEAYNGTGTVAGPAVAAGVPQGDVADARTHWSASPPDRGDLLLPGLTAPHGGLPGTAPAGPLPGAAVRFTLDADLTDALDSAVRKLALTRFEVLLSAVFGLLRRYGNDAPTIGVDVSTRTAETTDHIGLFVNELPVTVDAPERATFAELAAAVRTELRAGYRFRGVPVAHALGGARPRTALTRVSVSYRRRAGTPRFAGLHTRVEWIRFCGTARNVLHCQLLDEPDGVSVSLQYATAALPHDTVDRIGAHLRTLLAAALATPDTVVADLPVLPPDERHLLSTRLAGESVEYPAGETLDRLFRAQVARTPHAIAATCAGDRLTYATLDTAVSGFADALRERGIGHGDLVAVHLPRSLNLLVAVLGVTRARAAFVPIERGSPVPRRELILADVDPALVLTTHADAHLFPALPVLTVDSQRRPEKPDESARSAGADQPIRDERPDRGTTARQTDGPGTDDLAYVMYTSGSTGRPNGVAVEHRHLAAFLHGMRDVIGDDDTAVWLGLTALSFDPCTVELFLPLISGGRVVIVQDDTARDPAALVELIRTEHVNRVQATPTRWRTLLEAGFGPAPVVALVGGEALPPGLARELCARVDRLHNVYGPTETTVWATAAGIAAAPDGPDDVTIGRPLPNVRVHLLDPDLRPVPLGLPGELCIGGPAVARGYLHRPQLTGERFVPDPWTPGSRLYRTGDLARYLPDGRLAFLGRRDQQIKIRGHRIEPGEIEACLLTHPDVAQAAVVWRGSADDADGGRLVAYTVHAGAAPAPAALREHVARALPAVMVPAVFVAVPALPMTATGKLDRRALPEATPAPRAPVRPDVPADGDDGALTLIREIWQEVLRVGDIRPDDDLFDLGGHSLTITQIISRIERRTGVSVPLDAFYDTPTVADIAAMVDAELARRPVTR
jgi:amino acid adenylation domain-containing protein